MEICVQLVWTTVTARNRVLVWKSAVHMFALKHIDFVDNFRCPALAITPPLEQNA